MAYDRGMKRFSLRILGGVLAGWVLPSLSVQAETAWPRFLGPGGHAVAADVEVPHAFGPGSETWKVETPEGHSSPCIWGDRVFLTGYRGDATLVMLAVDRKSGKTLWERTVEARGKEAFSHVAACPAMPTPCTNGELVFFTFGAYGLIASTLDGKKVWEKAFEFRPSPFGHGSSPIVVDDTVVLVRDQSDDPAIVCLNASDGNEKWKRPRIGYGGNYSTPLLWEHEGGRVLVVPGSQDLIGLNPENGELIWEVKDTCGLPCTSPVATKDLLFYAAWATVHVSGRERLESGFDPGTKFSDQEVSDPKAFVARFDKSKDGLLQQEELPPSRLLDAFAFFDRDGDGALSIREMGGFLQSGTRNGRNIMLALKPGGKGVINDSHVVWERSKRLPYVPSPLVSGDRVYTVKDGGLVACLDTQTGKAHFDGKRLGVRGEFYASPVRVGSKILLASASGTVAVLQDGEAFDLLAKNDFGEGIFATPAAVDGTLYVRSKKHLWAFSGK